MFTLRPAKSNRNTRQKLSCCGLLASKCCGSKATLFARSIPNRVASPSAGWMIAGDAVIVRSIREFSGYVLSLLAAVGKKVITSSRNKGSNTLDPTFTHPVYDARTTCARRSRGGKALGAVPRAGPCELRTPRRNDTPGSPARSFGAVELHRALYGVFESVCLKIRHISSKLPRRRHIRTTAVNCISRDGADPWDVVAPLALYLRCNFVVSSFGS